MITTSTSTTSTTTPTHTTGGGYHRWGGEGGGHHPTLNHIYNIYVCRFPAFLVLPNHPPKRHLHWLPGFGGISKLASNRAVVFAPEVWWKKSHGRKLPFGKEVMYVAAISQRKEVMATMARCVFVGSKMGVSKNNGTPESSILIGFSVINQPFWGTPIFWKTPKWQDG